MFRDKGGLSNILGTEEFREEEKVIGGRDEDESLKEGIKEGLKDRLKLYEVVIWN